MNAIPDRAADELPRTPATLNYGEVMAGYAQVGSRLADVLDSECRGTGEVVQPVLGEPQQVRSTASHG